MIIYHLYFISLSVIETLQIKNSYWICTIQYLLIFRTSHYKYNLNITSDYSKIENKKNDECTPFNLLSLASLRLEFFCNWSFHHSIQFINYFIINEYLVFVVLFCLFQLL